MDVRTGDVLAMVSSPTINPNYFVEGFSSNELARLEDMKLRPRINRATQENYAPGSIFKPIVALAALENGLEGDHHPAVVHALQQVVLRSRDAASRYEQAEPVLAGNS